MVMAVTPLLQSLARLYNIQASFQDGLGQQRNAPAEAVLAALRALGAPVNGAADVSAAYRQRHQSLWQQLIEPVLVVWQNQPLKLQLRLPARLAEAQPRFRIALESGAVIEGVCTDDPAISMISRDVEGVRYVRRRLRGPAQLPLGYHRLHLSVQDLDVESYLICAPVHAYSGESSERRSWGLFCPLYALHSDHSWGAGDFGDLEQLVDFTAELGGQAVATLPLLASFLDEPFNPSPYAPVSRQFWNEFFIDVERVAELPHCSEASALMSTSFGTELRELAKAPLVPYREIMARKRKVLEALARYLLSQSSQRRAAFETYLASHPAVQDYAAFRAKSERERQSWTRWPADNRDGLLSAGDFNESSKDYHLYVQWLCAEQTAALRDHARAKSTALYLDFPLGVNRDGFDVCRNQDLFALDINGGAPPDGLFIKGQNWGFPPLKPEAIRAQGYRYHIDCLRHHLQCAGMLRIDHIMGWHRAYWVPAGMAATDGVYVRYQAREFHAILNLESQRQRVQIVGENLGTVPSYVNEALARHKILGMHVGQFGVHSDPQQALDDVPAPVVASLNTHDTATFMGFWQGLDIDDHVDLGLQDEHQAQDERRYRAAQRDALGGFLRRSGWLGEDHSAEAVLHGWLKFLAASSAQFLLINLEDLWLEPAPQNVPGTWQERLNWQRKTRYSLEELRSLASINDLLKAISDIRRRMG